MQSNVSLCVIVKNSEDTIDMFMNWALDNFEEVNLVVDPENDDSSLEICCAWEDGYDQVNLLVHPFDNFSNQRDRSFEMATKDYVMFIDTDEIMEPMPPNILEKTFKAMKRDILAFPRLNLQRDHKHYHISSYPDYQLRLVERYNAKMDGKPVDETLDTNGKLIDVFANGNLRIIHFGHIRPKKWLKLKGKDRLPFAKDDGCDGSMLIKHGEDWFLNRNEDFDKNICPLSGDIIKHIEKYIEMRREIK